MRPERAAVLRSRYDGDQSRDASAVRECVAEIERLTTELATVRAERDRLLAVVVAQAEATDAVHDASVHAYSPAYRRWSDAVDATEALGRELRGGAR